MLCSDVYEQLINDVTVIDKKSELENDSRKFQRDTHDK